MKPLFSLALLSSGLTVVGSADAGITTNTFDVSVVVGSACTVSSTPADFGTINPADGNWASGSIVLTCNPNITYTIALDAGQNFDGYMRRISNGLGDYMFYDLINITLDVPWGDKGYGDTNSFSPVQGTSTGYDVLTVGAYTPPSSVPEGLYSDVVNVIVYY